MDWSIDWTSVWAWGLMSLGVSAVWRYFKSRRPDKDERIRALALDLAVASHGEAAGSQSDRCFTARAEHFEEYLRTGRAPSGPRSVR